MYTFLYLLHVNREGLASPLIWTNYIVTYYHSCEYLCSDSCIKSVLVSTIDMY